MKIHRLDFIFFFYNLCILVKYTRQAIFSFLYKQISSFCMFECVTLGMCDS